MRVTFGIVNCNRLHYLRACLESLEISTMSYSDKEIIVIDNASIEPGTDEYLKSLEKRGILVVRNKERDPSNEFAKGLNTIVKMSTGEVICPLSGDLQFAIKDGWLSEFVEVFKRRNDVGSIMLDIQRNKTNKSQMRTDLLNTKVGFFYKNLSRPPIATSGNSLFLKTTLVTLGPWSEDNKNHEGTDDSETKMLKNVQAYCKNTGTSWYQYQPVISPAIMITNDPRGTNARIRGEKRYGKYIPGVGSPPLYYEMYSLDEINKKHNGLKRTIPIGFEDLAVGIGWSLYLDEKGDLKKNPIRVEECTDEDWEFIDPQKEKERRLST